MGWVVSQKPLTMTLWDPVGRTIHPTGGSVCWVVSQKLLTMTLWALQRVRIAKMGTPSALQRVAIAKMGTSSAPPEGGDSENGHPECPSRGYR